MMEDSTKNGLLPKLCLLAGCPYLSDLHNSYYSKNVLGALNVINISKYSLKQWNDAYRYITGKNEFNGTEEEIVRELIRYLENKTNRK